MSNACHEDVMKILNQAKQPVQVEILTKEDENDENKTHSTAQSNFSPPTKPTVKVDKQVQTDSKWLDDLIYEHCSKCSFQPNDLTIGNHIKGMYYKGSDSDDFYEVLDYSDNYIEELEDDFIVDESCDAFEYKVRLDRRLNKGMQNYIKLNR